MAWHDITTAGVVILAFFGALSIIGGGVKVIKEWWDPMAKLSERTKKLEQRADATDEKYEQIKKVMNAQSRLLVEISTHLITGNDIEALKAKRDELTDAMLE